MMSNSLANELAESVDLYWTQLLNGGWIVASEVQHFESEVEAQNYFAQEVGYDSAEEAAKFFGGG